MKSKNEPLKKKRNEIIVTKDVTEYKSRLSHATGDSSDKIQHGKRVQSVDTDFFGRPILKVEIYTSPKGPMKNGGTTYNSDSLSYEFSSKIQEMVHLDASCVGISLEENRRIGLLKGELVHVTSKQVNLLEKTANVDDNGDGGSWVKEVGTLYVTNFRLILHSSQEKQLSVEKLPFLSSFSSNFPT